MIIFTDILGSLLGGVIFSVVLTALLFLLCRVLNPSCSRNAGTGVILTLLFLLLTAQGAMLCGAWRVKGHVNDVRNAVTALLPDVSGAVADSQSVDYDEVLSSVADKYPMLSSYIETIDPQAVASYVADGGSGVASFVAGSLTDSLNSYMLRRAMWMGAFFLVALIAVLMMRKKEYRYQGDGGSYYDYGDSTSASYGGTDDY